MLRRARARLVHHGGQTGGAALRDDDAVDARAFRGAQNGAEIVRIGDLVAHDDERVLAPLGGAGKNVVNGRILPHCRLRDDALMRPRRAERIELAAVALGNDDARLACLGENAPERAVGVAAGDENLVDRPSGADRLGDGVASLDEILAVLPDVLFAVFHISKFLFFIYL